jgi:polysaccharide pyruvyl transferase WcaK-like protein
MVECFLRSERFLCGGGSLLQNGTGNLSLGYYLSLLRLARLCGCETELLAGGIGPLRGEWAERAVLRALERCNGIELRDSHSETLLRSWGIPSSKLRLRQDPAMGLPIPEVDRLIYLKREAGISRDQPYLCAAVRWDHGCESQCAETVARTLGRFADERGILPVFLTFDSRRDSAVTQRCCELAGGVIPRLREPSDALCWISGATCMVSMRLHGLIFSASADVPAIGISPSLAEPKLATFCTARNFGHLTSETLTPEKLWTVLEKMISRF